MACIPDSPVSREAYIARANRLAVDRISHRIATILMFTGKGLIRPFDSNMVGVVTFAMPDRWAMEPLSLILANGLPIRRKRRWYTVLAVPTDMVTRELA